MLNRGNLMSDYRSLMSDNHYPRAFYSCLIFIFSLLGKKGGFFAFFAEKQPCFTEKQP